ncbi:hypothetical protein D1P53_002612 [Cryptococcus gattii VGV]|nr:hypothetical protein D1P53_002612 [Cryptococcus gattii VGV]
MLFLEEKMKETPRMTTRAKTGMQGRASKGRRMNDSEDGELSEGAKIVAAISNSIPPRGRRADLMDLHSALMAMDDTKTQRETPVHKERLAEEKARRDREEQALEEPRRMERRMKEEKMEYRRKEVSAKEDASILGIAQFVLPSVSGNTVEVYKKAVTMYEAQHRQEGEDNNS